MNVAAYWQFYWQFSSLAPPPLHPDTKKLREW